MDYETVVKFFFYFFLFFLFSKLFWLVFFWGFRWPVSIFIVPTSSIGIDDQEVKGFFNFFYIFFQLANILIFIALGVITKIKYSKQSNICIFSELDNILRELVFSKFYQIQIPLSKYCPNFSKNG
jgi:hypothetical protein